MPELQVMSDLHFEHHRDSGVSFLESLDPEGVDALVLAGDICASAAIPWVLEAFCSKYPTVFYVPGNHEYYYTTRKDVRQSLKEASEKCPNLHWLDNGHVEWEGLRIVGGTMWFPRTPGADHHKGGMYDFHLIKGLESWVYKENQDFCEMLEEDLTTDSVVITHHLPSYRSVPPRFVGHPLNPFFVCDVEEVILRKSPKLWIHGHTHSTADYQLGDTRVVCNPFGYPREGGISFSMDARFSV